MRVPIPSSAAGRFVMKALVLLACFYLVTAAGASLFDRTVNWRTWQDPRSRILWEGVDPTAEIFIIGDSAFVSGYADREDQTLWKEVERLTSRRVFEGALDGAEPLDFLQVARLLAQYPGEGKIVVLDIIPTRFLQNRIPSQEFGNYPTEFSRRVDQGPASRLAITLMGPLHVLDLDILVNVLKHKRFYGTEEYRNSLWADDPRARAKFQVFEQYWLENGDLKDFSWLVQLHSILAARGYRLLLVLTPANSELVESYASVHPASSYESRMAYAHTTLTAYLTQSHLCFIDAYGKFQSSEFADMVHVNARGDRHLAELIAHYLSTDQLPCS